MPSVRPQLRQRPRLISQPKIGTRSRTPKRRPQCGRECNICALHCSVQAIHPDGVINPNECIHCLNCQTLYHDETSCPPLIARRKRRDGRAALKAAQGAQAEGG